jgi:hypothetical protein
MLDGARRARRLRVAVGRVRIRAGRPPAHAHLNPTARARDGVH